MAVIFWAEINRFCFIAGCIFISIEVMRNSVAYERENLPSRHPQEATVEYGFSFGLAWCVVILHIITGLLFLICSRKRKREDALSDDKEAAENEPVHIGR